jgi:hypothetical protein
MPFLAIAFAAVLCALTMPAAAADLDWQIVNGATARDIERQIQRWAASGYRVQAIVADAPGPTVVVAREGGPFRRMPPSAEYRVLDSRDGAQVSQLGAEGFRLRALARARSGRALAIFERNLSRPSTTRDYRSLMASPGEDPGPLLTSAADAGYRITGAVGESGSEWLILEQEGSAARESRVVSAPDVDALEAELNRLASEGFGCDTVWNRPPKGFAPFKGGTLMAALSRRRGATTPAAHVTIDKSQQPSASGQFIALVPYRNNFAFVIRRAPQTDYSVKEATFPAIDAKKSFLDEPLLQSLRSRWWNPIELAWAITSGNKVTAWVGLERSESRERFSSTKLTRRDAETIAVPSGAKALPRGGAEPGDAYRAQLAAIARGDVAAAKALWTGKQQTDWEARVKTFRAPLGLGFSEKDLFKSLRDNLPTDPVVLGGWINSDRAQLRVEATYDGTRSVTDVELTREAGVWKVSDQRSWQAIVN